MNFSDWLLDEIKKRDWRQADLAKRSGLTTASISKYVNGRVPNESALRKIAKAFGMPPELVFEKSGILPPRAEDTQLERIILATIKELPERDQRAFLAMLEAWVKSRPIP